MKLLVVCYKLQGLSVEDRMGEIFDKYTNAANEMDAKELMQALNTVFHTNSASWLIDRDFVIYHFSICNNSRI